MSLVESETPLGDPDREHYPGLEQHKKITNFIGDLVYDLHPLGRLEPLNHGPIFKKIGVLYTGLAYGHIHLPINLTMLSERQTLLKEMNNNLQRFQLPMNSTKESIARLNWVKNWVNQTTLDSITKLGATLDSFEYSKSHLDQKERKRRQVFWAMGGALIGGLITSIVSQFRQSTLLAVIQRKQTVLTSQIQTNMIRLAQSENDIKHLNRSVSLIMNGLEQDVRQQKKIRANALTLTTAYAITETAHRISALTNAMELARSGQFSISLVNAAGLINALKTLQEKAMDDGRRLDVRNIMDLRHLPCSYAVDFENKTVHVIVHVPMSRAGSALQLFEYIDAPALISSTRKEDQPLFMEVQMEGQFLALSDDDSQYQTYTENSLKKCSKLAEIYFCPDLVLYKKNRKDCLMALYDNDPEVIESHCPLVMTNHISKASRLNETTYIVTETERKDLNVVCNGNRITRHPIHGTVQIHVDRGCVISTDNMVISRPSFEAEVQMDGLVINKPIDTNHWIPQEEHFETITAARHLLVQVGQKIPLNLVKGLARFRSKLNAAGTVSGTTIAWAVTPSALMIVAGCVGLPLVIWIINNRRRRARQREAPDEREMFSFQTIRDSMSRMQRQMVQFQEEMEARGRINPGHEPMDESETTLTEASALPSTSTIENHYTEMDQPGHKRKRSTSPAPNNSPVVGSPTIPPTIDQHPTLTLDRGAQQLQRQLARTYDGCGYILPPPPISVGHFSSTPPPNTPS